METTYICINEQINIDKQIYVNGETPLIYVDGGYIYIIYIYIYIYANDTRSD